MPMMRCVEEMVRAKNPCAYEVPCREEDTVTLRKVIKGKEQQSHDALPRDVAYSYMPPAYYAKGYRILPAYKREFDFSEMRKLLFLEDPEKVKKWGALKARLPYPENRVIDLPGTRNLHYKNYCLRSLTPESAMSWRKSIAVPLTQKLRKETECPAKFDIKNVACTNRHCPFNPNYPPLKRLWLR